MPPCAIPGAELQLRYGRWMRIINHRPALIFRGAPSISGFPPLLISFSSFFVCFFCYFCYFIRELAPLKIAHLACRFRKADVRDATQKGPRAIFSQGRRVETPFRADRRRFDGNPIGILTNGRYRECPSYRIPRYIAEFQATRARLINRNCRRLLFLARSSRAELGFMADAIPGSASVTCPLPPWGLKAPVPAQ